MHSWRAHPDLNQGPADLQSAALATERCTRLLLGARALQLHWQALEGAGRGRRKKRHAGKLGPGNGEPQLEATHGRGQEDRKRAHPDLSQGPADLQSAALTTELCTHVHNMHVRCCRSEACVAGAKAQVPRPWWRHCVAMACGALAPVAHVLPATQQACCDRQGHTRI